MIAKLLDLKKILENLTDYNDPIIRAVAEDCLVAVDEMIDEIIPSEEEIRELEAQSEHRCDRRCTAIQHHTDDDGDLVGVK